MLIPSIGPYTGYRTKAVHLAAASQQSFRVSLPPGCASNNQGTISLWFKIYSINDALDRVYLEMFNGSSIVFNTHFTSTVLSAKNRFAVRVATAAGSGLADTTDNTTESVDGLWHHCMVSWRRSPSALIAFYRDGAADGSSTAIPLSGSTDWTQVDQMNIGFFDGSPDNWFDVDLAELWFDTSFVNDPTKFRDPTTGKPNNLGSDGSSVTGSAPPIYLTGGASQFGTNRGYGPNFTAINSPTDATSSPTD